jgi:hypothetical protein
MSQAKRILLGTIEIGRQLHDLADGFRRLGHNVDTIVKRRNPQQPDLHYDFQLRKALLSDRVNRIQNPLVRYPRGLVNRSHNLMRLFYFLTAYDVYVFQFGGSLLPRNRDYPLLKLLGKKIISIFVGDDIRHVSADSPVSQSFGLRLAPFYHENVEPLLNKLSPLRMAEKYADVILAQPPYAQLAIRPYKHLYITINLSLYGWNVPNRDVPLVIHAPSFRQVKGTEEILSALARIKSEGIAFELRLLEGRSNQEVIRELMDADVVVDQLEASSYGMLALEGMATGCAVAGGNHYGFIPIPPNRPIVHIDSTNVYPQLKQLLTDRDLRLRLAFAGRSFAERYNDHVKVAQNLLQCLEQNEERQYDYYPTFFARDYRLPEGERIPDDLKKITAQIVQRWGLPEDVDPRDLVQRGLMSTDGLDRPNAIPRWKSPFAEPVLD